MSAATAEAALVELYRAASQGDPFIIAGRHYVPADSLEGTEQELAALRWGVANMRASLDRIQRLCAGDRFGIVSKGEIRDAI